ncbi:MAG: hypothetical protein V4597_18485 [Pseudomonadota bacterium]
MNWRAAASGETAKVGDYPRYPGARLLFSCALCDWSRDYDPERIIDRLRQLKVGGHDTRVVEIARRVGRTCPRCGQVKWRADFAWPPGMRDSEVRRIADRYRN